MEKKTFIKHTKVCLVFQELGTWNAQYDNNLNHSTHRKFDDTIMILE